MTYQSLSLLLVAITMPNRFDEVDNPEQDPERRQSLNDSKEKK